MIGLHLSWQLIEHLDLPSVASQVARGETFTLLYGKFIQDSMYQFVLESVGCWARYEKILNVNFKQVQRFEYIQTVSQKSSHLWTQILTDFQHFCNAEKCMKFATKLVWHYPPHLRYVATLPWEIKNSNFMQIFSRYEKYKQITLLSLLTLLFIHKFWYFT